MFRKILTIFISLMDDSKTFSKAALILFILGANFYHHSNSKPFSNHSLNKLEFQAILASGLTIFCGLFYLSQIDDVSKAILFALILAINIIFLISWGTLILRLSIKKMKEIRKSKSKEFKNKSTLKYLNLTPHYEL